MNINRNYVYAAYETKTGCELCIALGETMKELGDQLGITANAVRMQIHRQKNLENPSSCYDGYYIKKVYVGGNDDEDTEK